MKGGLAPLSHNGNDQSELAEARASARGSFDCRRGAPGSSGGGLNSLLRDHPNQSSDVPPSRTARPELPSVPGQASASLTAPKKWRRTSGSPPACPGGMCERGARPPFTKWKRPIGTRRSARQRAREFRLPARSAGRFGRGGSIPSDSTIRTHPTMCPPFRNARPLGAERRAVREGGLNSLRLDNPNSSNDVPPSRTARPQDGTASRASRRISSRAGCSRPFETAIFGPPFVKGPPSKSVT